jgi:hypothetical protein
MTAHWGIPNEVIAMPHAVLKKFINGRDLDKVAQQ